MLTTNEMYSGQSSEILRCFSEVFIGQPVSLGIVALVPNMFNNFFGNFWDPIYLVSKMPKNVCTNLIYLYQFIDYNEVCFSYRKKKTEKEYYLVCLIFNVCSNLRLMLKLNCPTFLAHSSEMLDLSQRWHFQDIC